MIYWVALGAAIGGAYWYSINEKQIAEAAVSQFLRTEFQPRFFNYPSLHIYSPTSAHFLAGGFDEHAMPASQSALWTLWHDIIRRTFRDGSAGQLLSLPVYFHRREINGLADGHYWLLTAASPRSSLILPPLMCSGGILFVTPVTVAGPSMDLAGGQCSHR